MYEQEIDTLHTDFVYSDMRLNEHANALNVLFMWQLCTGRD